MGPRDYFNVVIYNTKDGKPEGVQLKALTDDEVLEYFGHVKNKEFGLQPVGNKKENVVEPDEFRIFDFSKKLDLRGKNRPVYKTTINKRAKVLGDFLTACEELGKDVTDTFGIKLEDILSQSPKENEEVDSEGESGSAQYKMEAETGEFKITPGNIKAEVRGGSAVKGDLTNKVSPIFPKEFESGIKDGSIAPAFRVEKIASVFASHLKNLGDESGQMIGVFGQWGRGKSYFTREVFKVLENEDPKKFLTIKFQAWRYQQTPSIWAYLFETFIKEYLNGKRLEKACWLLILTVAREGHWKSWLWPLISIAIAIIAFLITLNLFDDCQNQLIIKILGLAGTLTLAYQKGKSILEKLDKPATTIFNSFSKAPSFKSVLGVQAEIEKELKHLLKAWKKYLGDKRILLFVDDLDRCNEAQIIEIIDSLRVILDDEEIKKRILILVALDEEKLKSAIESKYNDLFKNPDKLQNIVSEYMDKLFISAIKLFPISPDDRTEFVKKLAAQINGAEIPKDEKKPVPRPSLTPTPESTGTEDETGTEGEGGMPSQPPTPSPNPEPEITKSTENLQSSEITIIDQKIRSATREITPRQIRILIYRYLLARNLWLIYFSGLEWKADDAVDEIM